MGGVDISATGYMIMDGGSGYSSQTTVTTTDFFNTPGVGGATATVTVDVTGAITAITPGLAGAGYVAPIVNAIDPAGTGSGAQSFWQN